MRGVVAWVTGSSRGIGRGIAAALAAAGARVVLHGTREDSPGTFDEFTGGGMAELAASMAAATGARVMRVVGDLSDEAAAARMVEEIGAMPGFGAVELLVCCAGGNTGSAGTSVGLAGRPGADDCLGISVTDIRSLIDRNLLSTILPCRLVCPGMQARRRGRVITIGSVAGTVGRAEGGLYAVAKAAQHEYTRCLAVQMRPVRGRCAPGAG